MIEIKAIPFAQPAGLFVAAVLPADKIIQIACTSPRKFDVFALKSNDAIQRELSKRRMDEIANYAQTVDAAFPTSILLALPEDGYELTKECLIIKDGVKADIVDGQHRIRGIEHALPLLHEGFELPVVFILNATEEQKALMFATINGKQTKVPASIIYDLFEVTETRSPQKTAHEIARALNSTADSAWYRRLKMLGKKSPDSNETLSQGTFIKFLLPHISDDPLGDRDKIKCQAPLQESRPKCVLYEYFRKGEDKIILKLLMNLFNAARDTWPEEWSNPDKSILTKTTGYTAIMKAFPKIYSLGKVKKDLSIEYFKAGFTKTRETLTTRQMALSSTHFPPSSDSENKLKAIIEESFA